MRPERHRARAIECAVWALAESARAMAALFRYDGRLALYRGARAMGVLMDSVRLWRTARRLEEVQRAR